MHRVRIRFFYTPFALVRPVQRNINPNKKNKDACGGYSFEGELKHKLFLEPESPLMLELG